MRPFLQRAFFAFCLAVSAVSSPADMFEPLFTATRVVGAAKVVRPGRGEEPMRAERSYPYGTRILVPAANPKDKTGMVPEVMIELARDYRFRIGPGSDVTVSDASSGEGFERSEVKVLDVAVGSVVTYITAVSRKTGGGGVSDDQVERNLAAIVVKTPVGQCSRLAQLNEVKVAPDAIAGEGYECTFTTQSGVMEITGPQYKISRMKRNTAVSIRGDGLMTTISTENGEYDMAVEKGADAEERVHFKMRCLAKIWRQFADVGGRMAVAVMIYYPKGNAYELRSYNYLAGQTNVDMWTSVAAAVSGEHSSLSVVPGSGVPPVASGAPAEDGSEPGTDEWTGDGGDGEWTGDDGDDDDWDGGDDAGSGGDDDDFGGFDFGSGW